MVADAQGADTDKLLGLAAHSSIARTLLDTWNNGNRDPGWGVAELQKMSSPTTVGVAADMQLPCYQTRESPSSGKYSIFCYRLTYISKMCTIT